MSPNMNILLTSSSRLLYFRPLVGKKSLSTPGPLNFLKLKYSTVNNENSSSSKKQIQSQQNRLDRIISKSRILSKLSKHPRFSSYFAKLSDAGITSTITSFLILHELTAIAPLFGLWYIFYRLDLPEQYELPLYFTELLNQCGDAMEKLVGDNYGKDLDHNRLILSGAISYSIVKILYPLRVFFSLWGAPYMGRWILSPFLRIRSKYFKKGEKST